MNVVPYNPLHKIKWVERINQSTLKTYQLKLTYCTTIPKKTIYIRGAYDKLSNFFVQAFKTVVDS